MALPITATPVLEGEEAIQFYDEMAENEKRGVPDEEVLRGMEIFNAVMERNPEMKRKFGVN
jgi:hypothetical protein